MAAPHGDTSILQPALVLIGAAVVAVPIFRRFGLSAIVGYLVAGVVIGPHALKLFGDPGAILSLAELGVVLLLFLIGLELKFSRLVDMRRDIFGLGVAQMLITGLIVAVPAYFLVGAPGATIAGLAMALSATSIALQLLEERGTLTAPHGRRAFSILLFQDMAIVPLLALVPLLSPYGGNPATFAESATKVAVMGGAVAGIILAGRYLLNPLFTLVATTGAREIMTATALLVVFGAAFVMQKAGLSMALGAFLAGLMLAESHFRHQLEADIEPFRGLLLGLFFIAVGMSIDLTVVKAHWVLIVAAAAGLILAKALVVFAILRVSCSGTDDAARAALVLTPAGEFSFVLFPLAQQEGLIPAGAAAQLAAVAALSMALAPPLALLGERYLARRRALIPDNGGYEENFDDVHGNVLVLGMGRFGQMVSQMLLARGVDVTIIDHDVEYIRRAADFGFKIFFGDVTRLDVLQAAGAAHARLIAVCVDRPEDTTHIVEMIKASFPDVKIFARAYDRVHALELLDHEVDYQIRETMGSAFAFGRATLEELGVSAEEAEAIEEDVRRRDEQRLELQRTEGITAGRELLHVVPTPLTEPKRKAKPLNPVAADVLTSETEFSS